MNSLTNNKKLIRNISKLGLAVLVMIVSFSAINKEYKENTTKIETLSYLEEEELIAEDLIEALYAEEETDIIDLQIENTVEIYDANDVKVFEGSKAQWENAGESLAPLKRKAELLFESEGTEVYKVF